MTITALNTTPGLLIRVDGTASQQQLDRVEGAVLNGLQTALEATDVEMVQLRDCPGKPGRTVDAWTGTDGGLQPNWVATALAALVSDDHSRILYGPVLLLTSDQRTGRCHALPTALVEGIGTAAARLGEASTIAGKVEKSLRG